jgi:hypothetical protein
MFSTFIICLATAIICILVLVLTKIGTIPLQGLATVSFILPGLIRVLLLVLTFAMLVIAVANLREYYVVGISGWADVLSLLVFILLFTFFMFDLPELGIADTLSTLGGCTLIIIYLYLVQD